MSYTLFTLAERPDLAPQIDRLSDDAWPAFLRHSTNRHWHSLFETFAPCQLLLCHPNTLVAVGHTVPLIWDGSPAGLPSHH